MQKPETIKNRITAAGPLQNPVYKPLTTIERLFVWSKPAVKGSAPLCENTTHNAEKNLIQSKPLTLFV
jgi:hypothetical protein